MKPLHGALVALIMLPMLLAQRALTTAPIPNFANRVVDAVASDAAGNVYTASRHFEGVGYTQRFTNLVSITKYSPDGERLYEISFPCCSSVGIGLLAADTSGGVVFSSIVGTDAPILNALQPQPLGRDLQTFVAKLDPAGNLIFSTYLGGTGSNQIHAIALDAAGAIYATGLTFASDFPVTPNGYQRTRYSVNAPTAFIAKLSANGDRLLYSSYLGGATAPCAACSVSTIGRAIAVDADGNVYVAGDSSDPDLPVTADSLQPATAGGFVAKLDPTGSKLLYLTRIPLPIRVVFAVAVDSSGAAYVAGTADAYNLGAVMKIRPGVASPLYSLALPLGSPRVLQLVPDNEVVVLGTGFISRVNEAGSSFTTSIVFPAFGSLSPSGDAYLVSYDNWLTHYQSSPTSKPSLLGAGSAAVGLTRRVSPGEIVSVYGFNLGPEQGAVTKVDESNRIATSLSGVRVSFDGNPAPLLYVSSRQINAVAPFSLTGRDTAELTVETPDGSTTTRVRVVAAQPEAFRNSTGFAAGINEDGSLLAVKQAPLGSIVSLFATGLGTLDPQVPDGSINRTPLSKTTLPIVVHRAPSSSRLPSDPAVDPQLEILYAGPAPGLVAGAFQVNFRMPADRGEDNNIRIYLEVGGIRGSVVGVPVTFR